MPDLTVKRLVWGLPYFSALIKMVLSCYFEGTNSEC